MADVIPFNKSSITNSVLSSAHQILSKNCSFSGGGRLYSLAQKMAMRISSHIPFFVTSATSALEMIFLLVSQKDLFRREVILPSYTFSSCANAILRAGLKPVFVDIGLNGCVDFHRLEQKITDQTLAVMAVEYCGIDCVDRKFFKKLQATGIYTIIDAAQSVGSAHWMQSDLWDCTDFVAFSFHDTKNVSCGEGGALFISPHLSRDLIDLSHIVFEKGTNRKKFINGEVNKYSWQAVGGSFICSEISLAFLVAQRRKIGQEMENRVDIASELALVCDFMRDDLVSFWTPSLGGNGHFFWLVFDEQRKSQDFLDKMAAANVQTVRHYTPLHFASFLGSPVEGNEFPNTRLFAENLIRVPTHDPDVVPRFKRVAGVKK